MFKPQLSSSKPPTWNFHIWQIGLLILVAGMIGWSAFIRPTTINKADTIVQRFDKDSTPIVGLSCWRIRAEMFYEHAISKATK